MGFEGFIKFVTKIKEIEVILKNYGNILGGCLDVLVC